MELRGPHESRSWDERPTRETQAEQYSDTVLMPEFGARICLRSQSQISCPHLVPQLLAGGDRRGRSMPNMTGRPGYRTMEMIGGSSVSYLARTPCVPLFSTLFNRGGNRSAFRLPGAGGDHFHCTVEPSPGHIRCRGKCVAVASYFWWSWLEFKNETAAQRVSFGAGIRRTSTRISRRTSGGENFG